MAPAPLILYSSATWQGLRDWLEQTLTKAAMLDLVQLSDDPASIVSQIAASGAGPYPGAHLSLESGSASIAAACS